MRTSALSNTGALAIAMNRGAGLLLSAGGISPAHAISLPVEAVRDLPEQPDRLAVGTDGTIYATLPTQVAISVEPRGAQGDLGRIIELPGAAQPFDIAVTSDGAVAYVSRLGVDGARNSVDRVDLATGEVTQIADVGASPTEIDLTDDEATLVVGSGEGLGVLELVLVDTATEEIRARVALRTQPYAMVVYGDIAYLGDNSSIQAVDLTTLSVIARVAVANEVNSLAIAGDRLVAALARAAPSSARLVAYDARTLKAIDSVRLEVAEPEFCSEFAIAASASRVYAIWGLGWAFKGSKYRTAVVPISPAGFGTPEPLVPSPSSATAVSTDRSGRWLALGGWISAPTVPGVELLETGDEIVPAVKANARIAKKKQLRVTGVTSHVAPGTKVTVHLQKGKKYVAQKKAAKVRAGGTFTWQKSFRGNSARLYVVVGDPGSEDSIRTKVIRISRLSR